MGRVLYRPGVWASVRTSDYQLRKLPMILHAETNLTLAPAIGQGRLIVADPDGFWATTLRPNDLVAIVFSSRQNQTLSGTVAQQRAGVTWSGVVDTAREYFDPRADYGRACWIDLSSYWALLAKTPVPLTRYFSGTYVSPQASIVQFATQAVKDVASNTGILVNIDFDPRIQYVQTAANQLPNDWTDPVYQNWASFLLTTLTVSGIECFFDEAGTFVLRPLQGMSNSAVASVPNEEIFNAQFGGTSDQGLVTNAVVSYTTGAASIWGVAVPQQPPGADPLGTPGTLPPALLGPDGKPAPRLGQRFVSLKVAWLQTPDAAARYGNSIRALGMANVDALEAQLALNGDLRIATTVAFPGLDRRYYLTTVSHMYEQNQDTETTLSGRFGMALDASWDPSFLGGGYSNVQPGGSIDLSPTDPTQVASANLPALADDPDVRWTATSTPISTADIDRFLRQHRPPSPLLANTNQIWTQGQQYGILPEFALAVWQAETQVGTDGSVGSQSFNPGNVGPGFVYLDWTSAIGAWYALLAGPSYLGAGKTTVSALGAVYAPNDQGQNPDWIPNVDSTFRALRQGALVQAVNGPAAQGAAAPGAAPVMGGVPDGSPFAKDVVFPISQPFGARSWSEPPGTYEGVFYKNPGFHRGVDYACPSGTDLYAVMDGTLRGGTDIFDAATGYGFCLYLLSGAFIVKYAHTEGFAPGVTDGQTVKRGDQIGLSGSTGNATGPHLHFEIDRGDLNAFVDPIPYVG